MSTAKPAALSLMELKVLQYLLQGCSIKRTANLLSRSEKTIMATKGKAMHKLGIKHSANLVAMREMLEYLYLEQIQSDGEQPDDRDDVVKGFQKHDSGANREIETLPSWLLPVDLIHSRVALIQ
ncbi:LuxR C-terminal-related transcriptional regulator [Serratia sp. L9]|uniref:LuxR C-terminal-related transcriptional regulator n=1 Tax=Serratia sp. L9 TaxID=3423946 RepID=UPI003D67464A